MPTSRTLRPTRPSAATETKYRKKLNALIEKMHRSVLWWLRAEYRRNEDRIVQDASPARSLAEELHRLVRQWEDEFDEESLELAHWFADNVYAYTGNSTIAAFKDAGLQDFMTVKFYTRSRHEQAILQSIIEENTSLIRSIPSQYLTEVEGLVQRSVQAGRDVAFLEDELQKRFDITERRARVIARDQNNKATQNLMRARMQSLGVTKGIWMHSSAGKTFRKSHVAMNGKEFDLAEGMYDYEVDRNVFPAELINCRCDWKPILPDFGKGGETDEE